MSGHGELQRSEGEAPDPQAEGELSLRREMVSAQAQEIADLNQKITLLEQEIAARNEAIDLLNEEITFLKQEVVARNEEITDLKVEVEALKGEVKALRHEFIAWAQLYEYYQELLSVSHKLVATCYENLSNIPPPPPLPTFD